MFFKKIFLLFPFYIPSALCNTGNAESQMGSPSWQAIFIEGNVILLEYYLAKDFEVFW